LEEKKRKEEIKMLIIGSGFRESNTAIENAISHGKAHVWLMEMGFSSFEVGVGSWEGKEEVSIKIEIDDNIKKLIDEREEARKNKDFKKADEIREKLKKLGIALEDSETGVVWKRVAG